MSARCRMRSRRSAMSVSRAFLHPHVVRHHEHLGEEPVDGRAKAGDVDERGAIVAARRRRPRCAGRRLIELVEQRALGRLDRARSRSSGAVVASAPSAMFFTRLNSTASAWKSSDARMPWSASATRRARSGLTSPAGRRRAHDFDRRIRAARARSGRARSRTPAPPARPRRSTARSCPARASAARASSGPSQTSRSMPGQLRQVHQDPHRALRLPAQAERIARSGRPLAGPRQRHERVELVGERHRRPARPPRRRAAARDGGASASTPIGRYW